MSGNVGAEFRTLYACHSCTWVCLSAGKRGGDDDADGGAGREAAEDTFDINAEDPRFAAFFKSHHFHADPTDANYLDTKAMRKLVARKDRARDAKTAAAADSNGKKPVAKTDVGSSSSSSSSAAAAVASQQPNSTSSLASRVASLKAKAAAAAGGGKGNVGVQGKAAKRRKIGS